MDGVLEAAGFALLATINVGLWTLRVGLAAAGRAVAASVLAGLDTLLFVLAFGAVMTALDDPLRVVGYTLGVAGGTLLAIVLKPRVSPGQSRVTVVVDGSGRAEVAALHARGWPVTATQGIGVRGLVAVLAVAVHDAALPELQDTLEEVAPHGFVLVEDLRSVIPTPLPGGMHDGTPPGRRSALVRGARRG